MLLPSALTHRRCMSRRLSGGRNELRRRPRRGAGGARRPPRRLRRPPPRVGPAEDVAGGGGRARPRSAVGLGGRVAATGARMGGRQRCCRAAPLASLPPNGPLRGYPTPPARRRPSCVFDRGRRRRRSVGVATPTLAPRCGAPPGGAPRRGPLSLPPSPSLPHFSPLSHPPPFPTPQTWGTPRRLPFVGGPRRRGEPSTAGTAASCAAGAAASCAAGGEARQLTACHCLDGVGEAAHPYCPRRCRRQPHHPRPGRSPPPRACHPPCRGRVHDD